MCIFSEVYHSNSFFLLNCYLFDLPTTCGYFFKIFLIFKIKFCVGHEMN